MKNFFLVFIFFFISILVKSQIYQNAFPSLYNNRNSVFATNDGGCVFFSESTHIVKRDSTGSLEWARKYFNGFEFGVPLGHDKYGIYGFHDSLMVWPQYTLRGDFSVIDHNGTLISTVAIPESLVIQSLHPTKDGGSIAAADIQGGQTSLLLKTDSSGNFEWIKYADTLSNSYSSVHDIVQLDNSDYIAIATYNNYNLLLRLDNTGAITVTKSITGLSLNNSKLHPAKNNHFLLTQPYSISLLDSSLSQKWHYNFLNSSITLTDAVVNHAGEIVISGATSANNSTSSFVCKLDTAGSVIWSRTYPYLSFYFGSMNTISEAPDGGYIFINLPAGLPDHCALIKTDSLGHSGCDSIMSLTLSLPDTMAIALFPGNIQTVNFHSGVYPYQPISLYDSSGSQTDLCLLMASDLDLNNFKIDVYPNPANSSVTISGAKDGEYLIEIFNLTGMTVFSKGLHDLNRINLELTQGIYIVKIQNGNSYAVKKLTIRH